MQEKRRFRTSNIDFVAYLKTKGIDFVNTEKSKNNNKIMFGYDFDFETLLQMQSDFMSDVVLINMASYIKERNNIIDIVKLI